MSADPLTRYERRNIEDTILLSFKYMTDTTFDFTVWNNVPGHMKPDEYAEWLEPFHQIFMKSIHGLVQLKGLVVGSSKDIVGTPPRRFWFRVIYLGQDPIDKTASIMVQSFRA